MRRLIVGLLGSLSIAATAQAMPWEKHPLLSFQSTPMAETPDQGLMGQRTTKGYFGRLDKAGYRCDARDQAAHHIRIICKGAQGNRFDYEGQFVGAGYLQLDHIAVDGVPLSRDGMIAHQDRVYEDQPASLEGE